MSEVLKITANSYIFLSDQWCRTSLLLKLHFGAISEWLAVWISRLFFVKCNIIRQVYIWNCSSLLATFFLIPTGTFVGEVFYGGLFFQGTAISSREFQLKYLMESNDLALQLYITLCSAFVLMYMNVLRYPLIYS